MYKESSAWAAESAAPCTGRRRPFFLPSFYLLVLSCLVLAVELPAHAELHCYTPGTATRHVHRKLCIKAHVYKEIKLNDGTRILDVCSSRKTAADCHFAFVSLNHDRASVGDLHQFVGKEIEVRGKILPINGRAEILISSSKQLQIAPHEHHHKEETKTHHSRFQPNPKLLKGFNATQASMPIAAPAFHSGSSN